MAKVKNKKRNLSEATNSKKKAQHKKNLNPFEVHINKEKMKVLGRKLKNDRGLPGVSRAKAIKKRKHTLLQEYKIQNKSNKFTDKRIGERNSGMTEEDRAMARFSAVRVKAHSRKSIFNLADNEILTHHGQTLSEIEKFDDPRSDDEESLDERDQSGKLDSSFVKEAHFGGGVLKKTGIEGAKSHKDLIDQLISESKKRKAEKQKSKEQTLELTEKLDTEWKDLVPLVNKNFKTRQDNVPIASDDYDQVIRELQFEKRGNPSDRLKSEDEIAKDEKEKLENLERERIDRMRGFIPNESGKQTSNKHKSADDLDDDFAYDSDPDVTLSYNEKGESNVAVEAVVGADDAGEDDGDEESEEIETDSEDDLSDLKEESSNSEREEDEEEINSDRNSSPSDGQKMEQEVLNEESAEETESSDVESSKDKPTMSKLADAEPADFEPVDVEPADVEPANESDLINNIKNDLFVRKEMMEKARLELPYTFTLPDSYENLQATLKDQSSDHQSVIIERMIKCNHPSLAEGNKEKLGLLFVYLLQHINDISLEINEETDVKTCFQIFDALLPQLFDLALFSTANTHNSMVEIMKEKQIEFRKNKKVYPGIDVLLFLKLVSCLFTTSDFRHQVVTSCVVFIEQMLFKCKVRSRKDVAYGLFLVCLVLEYSPLSKRYLPASLHFLSGILHMAVPKTKKQSFKVLPPFKSTSNALVLSEGKNGSSTSKLQITDLVQNKIDDDFKITALYISLQLIKEFTKYFQTLPSNCEIFDVIQKYLQEIPMENYPEIVENEFTNVVNILKLQKAERKLDFVVLEKKRPKPLRLYEPNIQKVYDGKSRQHMSRERAEREKMLHKIKREHKGALREIRRDKAFLGRVKISQRVQSDKERQEKVKRIFAEANVQQCELNSMGRKKKRK